MSTQIARTLTLTLDDYNDAAGTNGGEPYMLITVAHDGTPQTTFRWDGATDDREAALIVVTEHAEYSPDFFVNHMNCVACAFAYVNHLFQRDPDDDSHEFYSEVFRHPDTGEIIPITWDLNQPITF